MGTDSNPLGKFIAEQRELQVPRLSQTALAKKAGLSRPYISLIESGDKIPDAIALGFIAAALNLNQDILMRLAGYQKENTEALDEITSTTEYVDLDSRQRSFVDSVGKRLREARIEAGYSLGEAASEAGMTLEFLGGVERGIEVLTLPQFDILADLYRVRPESLMGRTQLVDPHRFLTKIYDRFDKSVDNTVTNILGINILQKINKHFVLLPLANKISMVDGELDIDCDSMTRVFLDLKPSEGIWYQLDKDLPDFHLIAGEYLLIHTSSEIPEPPDLSMILLDGEPTICIIQRSSPKDVYIIRGKANEPIKMPFDQLVFVGHVEMTMKLPKRVFEDTIDNNMRSENKMKIKFKT